MPCSLGLGVGADCRRSADDTECAIHAFPQSIRFSALSVEAGPDVPPQQGGGRHHCWMWLLGGFRRPR